MGISSVISAVTTVTGISYQEMKQKTRKREIVSARQWVMFFAPGTLEKVGERIGKCHATVLYSKRAKRNLMEYDKQAREEHDYIYELLNYDQMKICVNCIQL